MDSSGDTAAAGTTTAATSRSQLGSLRKVKITPYQQQKETIQWKNPARARIYNRRLIDSLRRLTITSASENEENRPPPPPRAVKDAADSALAMTALGQSRWSRAILSRQWKMRKVVMVKPKVKKRKKEIDDGGGGARGMEKKKMKERLKLLGHLVPGCRKVSMEDLLEETADYVSALELQVKAMKALADALSASSSSTTATISPPLH